MKSISPHLVVMVAMGCWLSNARAEDLSVASPDGKVVVSVRLTAEDGVTEAAKGRIVYRVTSAGAAVLEPSPLGIVRKDAAFANDLALESAGPVTVHDSTYTVPHGKRKEVRDHYSERVLTYRNPAGGRLELHLRAYDDGVALRYRFPEESKDSHTVSAEQTGFRLPEGSKVWAHPHDDPSEYTPGYEAFWQNELPAGTPAPKAAGWSFPLLFQTPAGRWGLISEAAVDGSYCGSRLAQTPEGTLYRLRFPDAGEGNGVGAVEPSWTLTWATPWRLIIVGETPAAIVESTLVENLNPPSIVTDTSWIKPGRSSWSWLFDPPSPQDATKLKQFVDLAAGMGWEYSLVDANWDIMRNGTVHDVIDYAKSKNVGIMLWYNSGGPHNIVTERPRGLMDSRKVRRYEFERLAQWGVKGVKIDFFQSDKQNIIALYHEILKDAADFKIMVNFHGCTLPRGWSRTYPHLMTMEAVRGEESYLFDERYPKEAPRHNTILAFTRNVVGPMDDTPVMFANNRYPHLTTFGHEIALSVLFETGILHFAGGPKEYTELADVPKDFLKNVPVAWDETRLVDGVPGQFCVIARRSGQNWYIGGIEGAGQEREVTLKLPFLGDGSYTATFIEDSLEGKKGFAFQTTDFGVSDSRTIRLRPNGGFAAVLTPKP